MLGRVRDVDSSRLHPPTGGVKVGGRVGRTVATSHSSRLVPSPRWGSPALRLRRATRRALSVLYVASARETVELVLHIVPSKAGALGNFGRRRPLIAERVEHLASKRPHRLKVE